MNPVFSGLLSALTYGVGDFLAGLASRRDSPLRVVALTHPLSVVALLILAVALRQPIPPTSDLLWGAAGGLMGLVSVLLFYRALAVGPMGAVSVGAGALSAVVPVAFGLFSGETLSPRGIIGGLAVLIGTAFLSLHPGEKGPSNGVVLGLLAGLGFGLFFVLLAQAHSPGVLWTLAVARIASSLVSIPLAAKLVGLRPQSWGLLLASFPGDTLGNLFYLLAVQGGGLAIGALLTSLYPAVTTLMAVVVLREHLRPLQWLGVAFALVGVGLLSQR